MKDMLQNKYYLVAQNQNTLKRCNEVTPVQLFSQLPETMLPTA